MGAEEEKRGNEEGGWMLMIEEGSNWRGKKRRKREKYGIG